MRYVCVLESTVLIDTPDLVTPQLAALDVAGLRALVEVTELPPRKPWGDPAHDAAVIELLVSTMSHALNEDFMLERIRRLRVIDPALLAPSSLATWSKAMIEHWFSVTLKQRRKDDPARLATLVSENFRHFCQVDSTERIDDLIAPDADENTARRASEWLSGFPAFSDDPLQKKSALFLQRFYMQGYLSSEVVGHHIPFAIDRHIARLSLRTGWVRVRHGSALEAKLSTRAHMSAEEDIALRSAILSVLKEIARRIGVQPPVLNFCLWQFARSYCARYEPGCVAPQRLAGWGSEFRTDDRCLLASSCRALRSGIPVTILDPVHRGGFY